MKEVYRRKIKQAVDNHSRVSGGEMMLAVMRHDKDSVPGLFTASQPDHRMHGNVSSTACFIAEVGR